MFFFVELIDGVKVGYLCYRVSYGFGVNVFCVWLVSFFDLLNVGYICVGNLYIKIFNGFKKVLCIIK